MSDLWPLYTARLRHDKGYATITTAATDARKAVELIRKAEHAPVSAVRWVRVRPTCDYCDQHATRYEKGGQETPLCWACAKDHYDTPTLARFHTGELGITRLTEVPREEWA